MSSEMGFVPDVEGILAGIAGARIGVVGDFCLDFYQFVDMSASEVSLETGLETLPVREVRYSLGGAGNVVNNLTSLGARGVRCYGVVGSDPHGELLAKLLAEAGASVDGLLVQDAGWLTQTYTKVVVGNRENPRIDWGNYNSLDGAVESRLVELIDGEIGGLDLIIINQQLLRGIHTERLRRDLTRLVQKPGAPPCMTDSRDFTDEYAGTLHKLNDEEGARLCDGSTDGGKGLEAASEIAAQLFERWGQPLLLTRGERGCLVFDESGLYVVPGIATGGPIDTVGAGDSMLAGAAAALASGRSLREGAAFGNLVAGVTVQKLHQTGTASPEEVRELAHGVAFRFRPELALAPERARYAAGTRIEIVTAAPAGRPFAHAIFDNDGTLSTLRQGWEEVMEPVMIASILGPRSGEVDEGSYEAVVERVRDYIDRTTGVQTIVQMHGLVEMVRDLGYVPADEVLTPAGYKEIYNRELMKRVDERLCSLETGELGTEDFLVKGALAFVRGLQARRVRVYLASGTDHDDVVREAQALGIAALFGESIYGSVGDVKNDPKKLVIDRILADIDRSAGSSRRSPRGGHQNGQGNAIVTFGDGPVEIRETTKQGGYCVGVASNEMRRFGLDPVKRKRLVEAGADLIVADFTQHKKLVELLLGD